MGAQYHHLANAVEPSVCGGNAAFCQISLTACFHTSEPLRLIRITGNLKDLPIMALCLESDLPL